LTKYGLSLKKLQGNEGVMRNFLTNNVVDKACSQHIFSDKTLLLQDRLNSRP